MPRVKRKSKRIERLNLIPILDAIFIFIFFLLMSAQFIDVYEIGSDAPAVQMVKQEDKKKPLNLRVKIYQSKLVITTGPENKVYQTLKKINGEYPTDKLNLLLGKLKRENKSENSIILAPRKNINYKNIVKIIDKVRYFKEKDNNGEPVKMFDQVMFESSKV
jgi:biopolymer transport protein ExbD